MSAIRCMLAAIAAIVVLFTGGCAQASSTGAQGTTYKKSIKSSSAVSDIIPGHVWAQVSMRKCASTGQCSVSENFLPMMVIFHPDGKAVTRNEGIDSASKDYRYAVQGDTLQLKADDKTDTYQVKDLTEKSFVLEDHNVPNEGGYYMHAFVRVD